MGAALLPMIIAPLIGGAVQSMFAPSPPAPVVIKPPPAQPGLSSEQAQQISQASSQKGQEFGQGLLQSILNRAKSQGVGDKEMETIKTEFNDWFGKNQDEISKSLSLTAAHSKAQADYINSINDQNTNVQLQALQAQQPHSGGFGKLLGGLATSALGGMFGGGGGVHSQVYQPQQQMISGPDTADYIV